MHCGQLQGHQAVLQEGEGGRGGGSLINRRGQMTSCPPPASCIPHCPPHPLPMKGRNPHQSSLSPYIVMTPPPYKHTSLSSMMKAGKTPPPF